MLGIYVSKEYVDGDLKGEKAMLTVIIGYKENLVYTQLGQYLTKGQVSKNFVPLTEYNGEHYKFIKNHVEERLNAIINATEMIGIDLIKVVD